MPAEDARRLSREEEVEEEAERAERELHEREVAMATAAAEVAAEAAAVAARLREANPAGDVEFKAIPADPMTVAETLVKVRGLVGFGWVLGLGWGWGWRWGWGLV